MNRDEKAAVIDEIASQIGEAEAIFAVDYRGITVTEAAELRGRLRDADATFRIVKNSLTERAADKAGVESLKELLDGPTAFTFVRGDAAVAAKALSDFARGHDSFSFKGGRLGAEELSIEQITSIARLPAREVLHAQLVGTIAAPITGLVRGLNALIAGIAIQLRQIADAMPAAPEAEAEPAAPEAEAEAEPAAPEAEAEAEPAAPEAEADADAGPVAPEADADADAGPVAPEADAEAEAPTDAEEHSSPVDEAPAEAAPDVEEPEAAAEEAAPEAEQDDNEADASAQADDDDTPAEAAKED